MAIGSRIQQQVNHVAASPQYMSWVGEYTALVMGINRPHGRLSQALTYCICPHVVLLVVYP
jgi:hypothetical protein